MNTWLITDTHFGHDFLIKHNHRPADYEEQILRKWKHFIHDGDLVFHLGDVIFYKPSRLGDILNDLPGTKILIRGNHDKETNGWYMRHGFTFVAQGILHGGVWLSHVPAMTLPSGAIMNVHGHLHEEVHHNEPEGGWPEHCKLLAIEKTGYAPVKFDDFVRFTPIRKLLIGGY